MRTTRRRSSLSIVADCILFECPFFTFGRFGWQLCEVLFVKFLITPTVSTISVLRARVVADLFLVSSSTPRRKVLKELSTCFPSSLRQVGLVFIGEVGDAFSVGIYSTLTVYRAVKTRLALAPHRWPRLEHSTASSPSFT